ncbi:uncharacterized protein LOC127354458 [Dicentrarchus labrax]|uniref:uncharacterized protein LOC127354458 n=1 Tax=Dicentrarchus labrax TaxID=13489 RepID=UPI0021F514AF|nr:uncharacterized protein LOC127354458 [Dicentrarchus labrax]
MKDRTKRRNQRKKPNYAGKHRKSRACSPAAEAKVIALRQVLQSVQKTNQRLVSLNTNLRKQVMKFTFMEMSWVKEKSKLMQENRDIQKTLGTKYIRAKHEINWLNKALKRTTIWKGKEGNERLQAAVKKAEQESLRLRECQDTNNGFCKGDKNQNEAGRRCTSSETVENKCKTLGVKLNRRTETRSMTEKRRSSAHCSCPSS